MTHPDLLPGKNAVRLLSVAVGALVGVSGCTGAIGDENLGQGGRLPAALCQGRAPSAGPAPLRRLTREEYRNTVRDLLGRDPGPLEELRGDDRVGRFESNGVSPVGELFVDAYASVAERLAAQVAANPSALVPCDPSAEGQNVCAQRLIATVGPRALRRPLEKDEVSALQAVFDVGGQSGRYEDGVRLVVEALLQAPEFLYHVQLGGLGSAPSARARPLTPFELAARLSYYLWKSMPDAELFRAAQAGELDDPALLAAQAERMLDDSRARAGLGSFHLQWLEVNRIDRLQRDPDLYPGFDDRMRAAMREDLVSFADYVVRRSDGRLETLLTAPVAFPSGPLFSVYGLAEAASGSDGPVPLPPGQRAGILTQPGYMTAQAHYDQSSPIRRGYHVWKAMSCESMPPPPPDVDNTPPPVDRNASTRDRFAQHTANEACASCHQLIDGIGFAFEHYDALGRYRERDGVQAVDARGWLKGTDVDGEVRDALHLAERLTKSRRVKRCMAESWFTFAVGRAPSAADRCAMQWLEDRFESSQGNLRDLILDVVRSDGFRYLSGE